jgi:dihydroflavonol-4-reductase
MPTQTVLVTGATSFLGYHVVRRLNEAGIRPRVLEARGSPPEVIDRVDVERCAGYVDDPAAVHAAAAGADTLLHLAFKVSVGGGAALVDEMRRVNVDGTRQVLQAAAAAGVRRAVVVASALGVGVNRQPFGLNELAKWSEHEFDLPYATIRRQAELEALSQSTPRFAVISVCPAFTFGPDDPVGAPANKLIRAVISRRLPFTLPVGFGCLDVRDFAAGMVLAADRGRPGERYLLSAENVTTSQLFEQVAGIAHVRAPRFTPPMVLVRGLVWAVEAVSRLRRKPAPLTRDVLQIVGRYAWYDTSKARSELGWMPRPLRVTLTDTIAWLRDGGKAASVRGSGAPPH